MSELRGGHGHGAACFWGRQPWVHVGPAPAPPGKARHVLGLTEQACGQAPGPSQASSRVGAPPDTPRPPAGPAGLRAPLTRVFCFLVPRGRAPARRAPAAPAADPPGSSRGRESRASTSGTSSSAWRTNVRQAIHCCSTRRSSSSTGRAASRAETPGRVFIYLQITPFCNTQTGHCFQNSHLFATGQFYIPVSKSTLQRKKTNHVSVTGNPEARGRSCRTVNS